MYQFTLFYILYHLTLAFTSQVLQNRMLTRSFTASKHFCVLNNVDWMECISRCNSDTNCVSYNFELAKETCWLNAYGILDYCNAEDKLVYSGGAVFQQLREDQNRTQCMASHTCTNSVKQGGQNSCQSSIKKSCKEILDHGVYLGDGEYNIKPDGVNEQRVYCDMTTKGGGWTLIKKYTITSVPYNIVSTTPVYDVNSVLDSCQDHSKLITVSGLKSVRNTMGFKQMRWFCHKKSVGKTVHVETNEDASGENVIRYFTETKTPAKACGSFTKLPDDTSKLSDSCSQWGYPVGQDQWGSTGYTSDLQRIHGYVMLWNQFQRKVFSMMPGQFQCDDENDSLSVNDVWALYVR